MSGVRECRVARRSDLASMGLGGRATGFGGFCGVVPASRSCSGGNRVSLNADQTFLIEFDCAPSVSGGSRSQVGGIRGGSCTHQEGRRSPRGGSRSGRGGSRSALGRSRSAHGGSRSDRGGNGLLHGVRRSALGGNGSSLGMSRSFLGVCGSFLGMERYSRSRKGCDLEFLWCVTV